MAVLSSSVLGICLAAAVAPFVVRLLRGRAGLALALVPAAAFVAFAAQLPAVVGGAVLLERRPWVGPLDVALAFRLDGLSLLFALLVTGVGALVVVYAGGYLRGDPRLGSFQAALFLFMASMLGLVLADDLLLLFVFWELTSVSSFLLIGYGNVRREARSAAFQALLVTGVGGLALLAGVLLVGLATGAWSFTALLKGGVDVRADAAYPAILALILLGAFTKSAQFPFHFWLPNAMVAPTPVSAYLHSATMVKAGVYLLARFTPVLGGTPSWVVVVTGAGAVTMAAGAFLALHQRDLKRVLAYSTVSALGTLVLLLGIGTPAAWQAMVVFLLAHALYKGALFQVAGTLDHATGTRHLEELGGLRRAMPLTAAAGLLAALSFAGLAPLLTFLGKELLLEALIADIDRLGVVLVAVVLSLVILSAVAFMVGLRPFFGPQKPTPREAREASPSLWVPPLVLATLGLVLGVMPGAVGAALVRPAVAALSGEPASVALSLWHGLTPALLLSLVVLAGGLVLYVRWTYVWRVAARVEPLVARGPEDLYERAVPAFFRLAKALTRVIQSGRLRHYMGLVVLTLVVLVGGAAVLLAGVPEVSVETRARPHEIGIALLVLAAALFVTRVRSRVGAVVALGIVGYGQALLYAFFGAPDLAMTQFLFETLIVLLFVLVFAHVPRIEYGSPRRTRMRDAALGLAFGGIMTSLVLYVGSHRAATRISTWYGEQSYLAAHGRNVVNVILVDFRALDTLGEITVLATAAAGVYGLLKLVPRPPPKEAGRP